MTAEKDAASTVDTGEMAVSSVKYILGWDVCIILMNAKPIKVLERIAKCAPGEIAISTITIAQLRHWAATSETKDETNKSLEDFLKMVTVLNFDESAAGEYGSVRFGAERQGAPVGVLEALVAAHAIAEKVTYVTTQPPAFKAFKQLQLEDWTKSDPKVS